MKISHEMINNTKKIFFFFL